MVDGQWIRLVSFDPALNNLGIAKGVYNLASGALVMEEIHLVKTENQAGKVVRKNSDDLRRAREHLAAIREHSKGASLAVAEVPMGTQSARGAMSNGICIGLLAAVPIPLIEVSPSEVKLAVVGNKVASKDEMIEWAVASYPELPWLRKKHKGTMRLVDANEHIADACAAMVAGTKTTQFAQAVSLMQGLAQGVSPQSR